MKHYCVATLISLIAFSASRSLAADSLNLLDIKEGRWELTGSIHPNGKAPKALPKVTHNCIQHVISMQKEADDLEETGCTISPVTNEYNDYTYSINCGARGISNYTLHADDAASFQQTIVADKDGTYFLAGRRVGDCDK